MDRAEAEAEITRELLSGERLLWSGIPKQGFLLRSQDAFAIPLSLFYVGFSIFWEMIAIVGHAPLSWRLIGAAFVGMGLYMFAGRFLVDMRRRARTAYGLTDRKIIIIGGLFGRRVKTLSIDAIAEIHLYEQRDGWGTLVFGTPSVYRFFYWSLLDPPPSPTFERVDGVRDVHEMLLAAQRARG